MFFVVVYNYYKILAIFFCMNENICFEQGYELLVNYATSVKFLSKYEEVRLLVQPTNTNQQLLHIIFLSFGI